MPIHAAPPRLRWRACLAGGFVIVAALGACTKATTTSPSQSPAASSPVPAADAAVTVVTDPSTIGAFMPASLSIKAGQTVQWTFQDANPHTVTADDGSFSSPQSGLTGNATYRHTFATAGTFAYHCAIHPQMKATVVVQ